MKSGWKLVQSYVGFSLVLAMPVVAKAVARVNLTVICDKWDEYKTIVRDIEWECSRTNRTISALNEKIASADKSFPFRSEAHTLKPTEFESDYEFKGRVHRRKQLDAKANEQVVKAKTSYIKQQQESIRKLSGWCVLMTNKMNQALFNYTNILWRYEGRVGAADLPYFDRESMSFKNIPCPLVAYEDATKEIRFDVKSEYRYISIKFDDIKCAQSFKNGLASGAIEVVFYYEFLAGEPKEYTFKEAWTEKKPNVAMKIGKVVGVALMLAKIANGERGFYQEDVARIEADDTNDLIEHPAIKGRAFPITITKCQVIVKGDKAKLLGMRLDSSHWKWAFIVK